MKAETINRRTVVMTGMAMILAGCQVVPKSVDRPPPAPSPSAPTAPAGPSAGRLPTDTTHHRVALLVPMSGQNAAVGQSLANATTMALLDTNAGNLRITTYDTATGARRAAERAVAEGNRLILGPLLASDVSQVLAEARPAGVPLISFSNDTTVAGPDVFLIGHVPEQSIGRTVDYARRRGAQNFAAILPQTEYGVQAEAALGAALRQQGGKLVAVEKYDRANTSLVSAAERLRAKGGFDTVLLADTVPHSSRIAAVLRPRGAGTTQLLGTELWSGESAVTRDASLRGAWFSAVSDQRYKRFADSYQTRFGTQPYRIATLGYDSVLLALRVARDWKVGTSFPVGKLQDKGGFLGLDGAFRFNRNGVIDRAMEVREIRDGQVTVISPAPATFAE